MKFIDIPELHRDTQFFMYRPSNGIKTFVIILACIIFILVLWSLFAKMDDVLEVNAFIRPNTTISLLKSTISGEIITKNYMHNSKVAAGTVLLQIDVTSDIIELDNSNKLMERINDMIIVYDSLINTINRGMNSASAENREAYLRSEIYLIEKLKLSEHIGTLEIQLQREKSKPEEIIIRKDIEDIEREIDQEMLQLSLWVNGQTINAIDTLRATVQQRDNLEHRIAELERIIKNATVYAPINGRINELRRLNIGDRVLVGEEIVSIIPDEEDIKALKAELYVDASYIARIKTGQIVSLRFPGLPPSRFGRLNAIINLIPADYTVMGNQNPIFIVEAGIDEPWLITANGERIYLQAGIGALGHIILEQDTVFRMILKKLDFIF